MPRKQYAEEAVRAAHGTRTGVNAGRVRNPDNAMIVCFLGEVQDTLRQKDDSAVLKAIPRALKGVREAEASLTTHNALKGVHGIGSAVAGIIENNLWSAYPPQATAPQPAAQLRNATSGEGAKPSKAASRAAAGAAHGAAVAQACAANAPLPPSPAAPPPTAHAVQRAKPYVPRAETANYAFLIVMLKAELLGGKTDWLKEELMAAADASGLANNPIKNPGAAAAAAAGNYSKAYDGWKCFRSNLLNRTPPLVQEWSNPKKVRLTAEGRALAKTLLATAITMGKVDPVPGFDAAAWNAAAQAQRAADDAANPPAPKKSRAKATKAAAPPVSAAGASTSGALDVTEIDDSPTPPPMARARSSHSSGAGDSTAQGCALAGGIGDDDEGDDEDAAPQRARHAVRRPAGPTVPPRAAAPAAVDFAGASVGSVRKQMASLAAGAAPLPRGQRRRKNVLVPKAAGGVDNWGEEIRPGRGGGLSEDSPPRPSPPVAANAPPSGSIHGDYADDDIQDWSFLDEPGARFGAGGQGGSQLTDSAGPRQTLGTRCGAAAPSAHVARSGSQNVPDNVVAARAAKPAASAASSDVICLDDSDHDGAASPRAPAAAPTRAPAQPQAAAARGGAALQSQTGSTPQAGGAGAALRLPAVPGSRPHSQSGSSPQDALPRGSSPLKPPGAIPASEAPITKRHGAPSPAKRRLNASGDEAPVVTQRAASSPAAVPSTSAPVRKVARTVASARAAAARPPVGRAGFGDALSDAASDLTGLGGGATRPPPKAASQGAGPSATPQPKAMSQGAGPSAPNQQPAAAPASRTGAVAAGRSASAPAGTLPAPPERAPWALPTLAADTVTSGATLSHVRAPPLPPRAAFDDVYTLALLIDNREQFRRSAKGDRAIDQSAFLTRIRGKERFPIEMRALPTGDALWVARCERSVPGGPAVGAEFVLDWVIERKSVDDLTSSIADDRYGTQKTKMQISGLRTPVYLVEGDTSQEGAKAARTAAFETEVWAGFHVVRTLSIGKTHHFFQQMTLKLVALFRGLPRGHRSPHGVLPTFDAVKGLVAASCKAATVSDVWTAVLSSSQGVGEAKARALALQYPTPKSFFAAIERCQRSAASEGHSAEEACVELLCKIPVTVSQKVGKASSRALYKSLVLVAA